MMRQSVIKLGGHGFEFGQVTVGNPGEVVMFVVIAHIPADVVHGPIVAARLLLVVEKDVVL